MADQPKLVIELFRHGARGPVYTNGEPYWRGKEGKLTDAGKAQHFIAGVKLMQRYPHLEKILMQPGKMYLQTTMSSRTQESLQAHLWGLFFGKLAKIDEFDIFDPNFYQKFKESQTAKLYFNPEIYEKKAKNFVPTQIHMTPMREEYELLITEICPRVRKMLEPSKQKDLEHFMRKIAKMIHAELGIELSPTEIRDFYDLQVANLFEGQPIKGNLKPDSELWKYIKAAGDYYVMSERFGSAKQRNILGVPLLTKIGNFLENAKKDTQDYSLVLLSAHEFTLMTFLASLDIIHPDCIRNKLEGNEDRTLCHAPYFASSILIELWQREGGHQVRMLYDGEPIPFCGKEDGFCDYDFVKGVFDRITSRYSMEDVKRKCGRGARKDRVSIENNLLTF